MKTKSLFFIVFAIITQAFAQTNVLETLNGDFESGNIDDWRAVEVTNGVAHTIELSGGVALPSKNSEKIGSSHVAQKYFFGTEDCLNEGADFLLGMGSKVIKIWYYHGLETPDIMYPWNSNWLTGATTLLDGLNNTYYTELFDKPFKSIIMNVASFVSTNPYYWRDNLSQAQIDKEEDEFYEFTKALLEKYAGSGKTFVLQHHEGDWHARGHTDASIPATPDALARMTEWLNARQRGVTRARDESTAPNVAVYHAAEINIVVNSMNNGQLNIVNAVLPYTNLDLVSYSAYDASLVPAENDGTGSTQVFLDAVRYIKTMMPDSKIHGNNNVYIGEYGVPENHYSQAQIQAVMENTVNVGLAENCPYIVYWQLYDNELEDDSSQLPITLNTDAVGFWLVRPDGSKSWHHDYLKLMINN